MSGMDRLTDEEWAVQYLEDDAEACSAVNGSHDQTTKDARRMEVLVKRLIRERDEAHRRASAAPADDALREAVEAERERIAVALEAEADLLPCAEDAAVTRSNAALIRADFSYEDADRAALTPASAQEGGE